MQPAHPVPPVPGYTTLEVLHRSPFTATFRAIRQVDAARVVIKRLNPELRDMPLHYARFAREAALMRRLAGDYVPIPSGPEEQHGHAYIVLPDLPGVPLEQIQPRPPPLGELLGLALSLARAIASLHQRSVAHDSLGPGVVIWDRTSGGLKFIDFSTAAELTDCRSDFRGLGEMLRFLSSPPAPLGAGNIAAELTRDAPPPLPPAFEAIIARLLAPTLDEGYQTAYGLLADLTRCAESVGAAGEVPSFPVGQLDAPPPPTAASDARSPAAGSEARTRRLDELEGLRAACAHLERLLADRTQQLDQSRAELHRLEREALELQMAGGFAHEMRNALTAASFLLARAAGSVTGEAEARSLPEQSVALLRELVRPALAALPAGPGAAAADAALEVVLEHEVTMSRIVGGTVAAVQRALSLTGQIMQYSKLGQAARGSEEIDVPRVLQQVVAEMRPALVAESIRVEVGPLAAGRITGTEQHFDSILKNLVMNARDALVDAPEFRERRIEVGLDRDGPALVLSVRDNGCGMSAEVRQRIFEPFFSTKPRTGTGLGLGMVRKLVDLYDGRVEVDSEIGRGSCFRIILPVTLDDGFWF